MWLRIFQHLLPRATAWRLTVHKTLHRFFSGLTGMAVDARQVIDDTSGDLYPTTTRQLAEWEEQFGLTLSAGVTDAARRTNLTAAWQAQGGQSPRYLQDVVQAAGFPLFLHEWWVPSSNPKTVRDPHVYTESARIGTFECTPGTSPALLAVQPECTDTSSPALAAAQPQCNRFLANDIRYIVNLDLTRDAPPAIPDDPLKWRFFVTWCGATYGDFVSVPATRRAELERLLRKLCPAQQWLVVLVHYV